MPSDMKWSEVPVGEVFSRRSVPLARWVRFTKYGEPEPFMTLLLVREHGQVASDWCDGFSPTPTGSPDDCYLTGEKLVVEKGYGFSDKEKERDETIVLRIEKAEPDLKVPVQFEYDAETIIPPLYDAIPPDESIAKSMFNAGIAHAVKAMSEANLEAGRVAYAKGKRDALAETEDMFEQGVEHGKAQERSEGSAFTTVLQPDPQQEKAIRDWHQARERVQAKIKFGSMILRSEPKIKAKELKRRVKEAVSILFD